MQTIHRAIRYYKGTKLEGKELWKDIIRNWPSQINNIDIIIRNVK